MKYTSKLCSLPVIRSQAIAGLGAGVTGSNGVRASAAPSATQLSAHMPATSMTAKPSSGQPTQKSSHAWSDPVAQLMARQHIHLTSEPVLGPAAPLQRQASTRQSLFVAGQHAESVSEPVLGPALPMQRQDRASSHQRASNAAASTQSQPTWQ